MSAHRRAQQGIAPREAFAEGSQKMRTHYLPILASMLVLLGMGCDGSQESSTESSVGASIRTSIDGSAPTRGFVMARWHDEIPGAPQAGECPDGLNVTEAEYFPEEWSTWMTERLRLRDLGEYLPWDDGRLPPDACQDPTVQPDPGFLTLDGPAVVHGLNLDGVASVKAETTSATCAHDDFAGPGGQSGIDNQMWRLMGCIRGYRPNDLMDRLHQSNVMIKEGGYAVLMEISGMDDPRNDEEIEVQILSANHTVTVDAVGGIMRDVSYTAHEDDRFQNPPAKGKIVDGVLTTEPVDLRIKIKQQTMDNVFWYRDARLHAKVEPDGRITGVLGAYQDLENFYWTLNEHWIGENHQGRNAAFNRGFMCAGIYHAMSRVADGHPDPETGRCTSISMALRFEAVPAFVIRSQQVAQAD